MSINVYKTAIYTVKALHCKMFFGKLRNGFIIEITKNYQFDFFLNCEYKSHKNYGNIISWTRKLQKQQSKLHKLINDNTVFHPFEWEHKYWTFRSKLLNIHMKYLTFLSNHLKKLRKMSKAIQRRLMYWVRAQQINKNRSLISTHRFKISIFFLWAQSCPITLRMLKHFQSVLIQEF